MDPINKIQKAIKEYQLWLDQVELTTRITEPDKAAKAGRTFDQLTTMRKQLEEIRFQWNS